MSKNKKTKPMFSLEHSAKVCKDVSNRQAHAFKLKNPKLKISLLESMKMLLNSDYKPEEIKKE